MNKIVTRDYSVVETVIGVIKITSTMLNVSSERLLGRWLIYLAKWEQKDKQE